MKAGSLAESGETLDEIITRSRGEVKHTSSPKVKTSTGTSASDSRGMRCPPRHTVHSPWVRELKREQSPSASGRGALGLKAPEGTPSNLGSPPAIDPDLK